jgi:hypothetical protein
MENPIIDLYAGNPQTLSLNENAISDLNETRKWGKFIAIAGLSVTSFMALVGLIALMVSTYEQDDIYAFGLILIIIPNALPMFYLLRYSNKLKIAIDKRDSIVLADSFKNGKYMFKFMAILMIIFAFLLALFIVFSING